MTTEFFTVDGAELGDDNQSATSGDVKCTVGIADSTATVTCAHKTDATKVVFPEKSTGTDAEKEGKARVYTFSCC